MKTIEEDMDMTPRNSKLIKILALYLLIIPCRLYGSVDLEACEGTDVFSAYKCTKLDSYHPDYEGLKQAFFTKCQGVFIEDQTYQFFEKGWTLLWAALVASEAPEMNCWNQVVSRLGATYKCFDYVQQEYQKFNRAYHPKQLEGRGEEYKMEQALLVLQFFVSSKILQHFKNTQRTFYDEIMHHPLAVKLPAADPNQNQSHKTNKGKKKVKANEGPQNRLINSMITFLYDGET